MSEAPPEPAIDQSILGTVKKLCQVPDEYTAFDLDLVVHINSAFGNLQDLGIGPINGFEISGDDEVWSDFLTGPDLSFNRVKSYISQKVRLAFDPPTTSYHITALEKQIAELEWRLSTQREGTEWTAPVVPPLEDTP